jgi:xylulokinase
MYLGIDLGTSGVKVLLLSAQQAVVATADAALTVQRPQPNWSEQDPQDWWQALELAIADLRAKAEFDFKRITAIGLSGQMHGAVVLNQHQQVIRPAIIWNDGRSMAQCAQLEINEPNSRVITGNIAMPGFTAPKLLWMREHEPQLFKQIATVLLPKDWLRFKLTGQMFSDLSDASGTLWLDVGQRKWSQAMLAASGLRLSQMPELVEGNEVAGTLSVDIAQRWGLLENIVMVVGGGGDNAASADGLGITEPGQGFISLGTSGVIFQVTHSFVPNPAQAIHSFAHALPKRWHQMAVMLSAASALTWAARLTQSRNESMLLTASDGLTDQQRMSAPVFLPYLSGERTPHNNPDASGVLLGLRHEHDAAAVGYAVMEGVSFGLLDGFNAMHRDGASRALSLVGGGAAHDAWGQLLSDLLSLPIERPENAAVAAALGAARLAWLCHSKQSASSLKPSVVQQRWEPSAARKQVLMQRYERFCGAYPLTSFKSV